MLPRLTGFSPCQQQGRCAYRGQWTRRSVEEDMQEAFPHLDIAGMRVLRDYLDTRYNCIAWALGRTDVWYEPGTAYPPDWRVHSPVWRAAHMEDYLRSFDWVPSYSERQEPGYDKIAVFASFGDILTHMARSYRRGWSSKIGAQELIYHRTVTELNGGIYGDVVSFWKRPRLA